MSTAAWNYIRNLTRMGKVGALLDPLVIAYYVTHRCNLNCAYCEDFGADRNAQNDKGAALPVARAVLSVIRQACDNLLLTGGEPLLHPNIDELTAHAREQRFRHITLLSNGLLLREHPGILKDIDRLVISLDTLHTAQWARTIGASLENAERIFENICWAAGLQKVFHFELVVNCVLSPQSLRDIPDMLDFCSRQNLLISFSPRSVRNWPAYEIIVSPDFRDWMLYLKHQKTKNSPLLGSRSYFQMLADLAPYTCHPSIVPRIMPDGGLIYPCHPIERENNEHGGATANLVDSGTWKEAVRQSLALYGPQPETCANCFQQCYAEPSLMQERPLEQLIEMVYHRKNLLSYAPG